MFLGKCILLYSSARSSCHAEPPRLKRQRRTSSWLTFNCPPTSRYSYCHFVAFQI